MSLLAIIYKDHLRDIDRAMINTTAYYNVRPDNSGEALKRQVIGAAVASEAMVSDMADRCKHQYSNGREEPCPHLVPAGAETCLWHNSTIVKSPDYVRELLSQASSANGGDLDDTKLNGLNWPEAPLLTRSLVNADLRDAQATSC